MLIQIPNTIPLDALARFARENGCQLSYPAVGYFLLEPRPVTPPVSAAPFGNTLPSPQKAGVFIR